MKIKQAAVLTWQRSEGRGTGMDHRIGACYAEALERVVALDVIVVPVATLSTLFGLVDQL